MYIVYIYYDDNFVFVFKVGRHAMIGVGGGVVLTPVIITVDFTRSPFGLTNILLGIYRYGLYIRRTRYGLFLR